MHRKFPQRVLHLRSHIVLGEEAPAAWLCRSYGACARTETALQVSGRPTKFRTAVDLLLHSKISEKETYGRTDSSLVPKDRGGAQCLALLSVTDVDMYYQDVCVTATINL